MSTCFFRGGWTPWLLALALWLPCAGTVLAQQRCVNTVSPATLPNGTVGATYGQTLTASGPGPNTFVVSAGTLPAGLALAVNGSLGGTPTTVTTSNFTITATDVTGCPGFQGYTVAVAVAAPIITLAPASLPDGTTGTSYSQTVTASGGTAPYSFAVTAGSLPTGLALTSTGVLSGTPTTAGTFNFSITAMDAFGSTGAQAFNVGVVAPTIVLAPAVLPGGQAGTAYSQKLSARGGVGPYTFTLTGGTLPNGLALRSDGTLSGTPTAHSAPPDQPSTSGLAGRPEAVDADAVPDDSNSGLALIVRPLLRLIQHLTGMETSFVTTIDWPGQRQEVLFSLNTGEMQVPERSQVDWSESMCRSMFLSGRAHSCAVGVEVPATAGALALGMRAFLAVPILVGDTPIGTVCAASGREVGLDEAQVESLRLIADAMQQMLQIDQARHQAEAQASLAALDARQAHAEADHYASDAEHMQHLAHSDALTGLPNRRAFMARWEEDLARSGRRQYPIALLLIDADRFKSVNDTLGHLAGDMVLCAIGEAVLAVTTSASLAARLGGDEFAFAISHASDRDLLATAAEIRRAFAVATAKLGVDTTLSIGIASSEHCPRQQLLAAADSALYRSKAGGGDRAELFSAEAPPA